MTNKTNSIIHQPGGQLEKERLPCKIFWRYHLVILKYGENLESVNFYIQQAIMNNLSRKVPEIQLESNLLKRYKRTINNSETTLPKAQSDLAKETLKDPYKFDFLTFYADVKELEKQLVESIMQLLLRLGKGFAFL